MAKLRKTTKPQIKHGGYELIARADAGSLEHVEVVEYLNELRADLVSDLGPKEEDLTAAERILIDRIITKIGVCRCIEKYVSRLGIFDKAGRLRGALKHNYLAYDNSITRALSALGIHTRKEEAPRSLSDIILEAASEDEADG